MSTPASPFHHSAFAGIIGVAREDITPPAGIYARNWGAATQDIAIGVHRPLYCKVLTLQNSPDDSPFVLASLDLGWWKTREDEWLVRGGLIEEMGLDAARVLINLSHTHAGPGMCREDVDLPGGKLIAPYLQSVREALLRAMKTALNSARNGTLDWSSGWCDLARDRDLKDPKKNRIVCGFNPEARADGTLLVGRAADESGKVFAVVTNYACHPTTLAWQNQLISPDWCGAFHELIENQTGAISLFLQGASGELQPRETYTGDTNIADAQGRQLGYAVLSTLESMLPPSTQLEYSGVVESGAPLATWTRQEYSPSSVLSAQQVEVILPLKSGPTSDEIEREMSTCEDRVTHERLNRKRRVRGQVGNGDSFALPVSIWQIGETIIVAQREEAYSQFQTDLRAAFPDKTIIVMNLTNGSCGYLPPAELYDLDIYQVWQTPYERGGLEKLVKEVSRAIYKSQS